MVVSRSNPATNFYTNITAKQHILDRVANLELTAKRVQEELDKIKVLQDLHKQHTKI